MSGKSSSLCWHCVWERLALRFAWEWGQESCPLLNSDTWVSPWDTAGAAWHAAPHEYRKHSASARSVQSSQQHCQSSCLPFYLVTLPILSFSYKVYQNTQHRNNYLLSDCPDCSDCTKVSASQCPCYLAFSCLGLSQEGVLWHVCDNLFPWYLLIAWETISIFFSPTSLPKTNQPRSELPRSSLAPGLPCLLAGAAFVCGCTLCGGV